MAILPSLPNFNLAWQYWTPGTIPNTSLPAGPVQVQLYIASRGPYGRSNLLPTTSMPNVILRASLASISPFPIPWVGAIIGGPLVTPVLVAYYKVLWWDVEHLGFPNAYVYLASIQTDGTGGNTDPRR